MNTCQFLVLCLVAVSAAEHWAEHSLGQSVVDTPEVAEAKRQHALAFMQIRSLFPEESDDYEEEERVLPPFQHHVHHVEPHHVHHVQPHHVQEEATQTPWKGPFAEHKLGEQVKETPEVAAARRHHDEVYAKVRAVLPELPEEDDERAVPQVVRRRVVPQVARVHHEAVPQVRQADIHDVEAAREAHVKAVMERIALLKELQTREQRASQGSRAVYRGGDQVVDGAQVDAARAQHARALAAVLGL